MTEKTFNIFWNQDLIPYGQTETINVRAESYSVHGSNAPVKSDEAEFDITYKNPCFDIDFLQLDQSDETILSDITYPVGSGE